MGFKATKNSPSRTHQSGIKVPLGKNIAAVIKKYQYLK